MIGASGNHDGANGDAGPAGPSWGAGTGSPMVGGNEQTFNQVVVPPVPK